MKTADAAKEIIALLEEAERHGVRAASRELREFLAELEKSPGLKKPATRRTGTSPRARRRVAGDTTRPGEAEMAKTIEQLAQRLRDAFESAAQFEAVLAEPQVQKLSKSNVVTLYKRVFEDAPAKSLTKPELFNAIRRERINLVRGRA